VRTAAGFSGEESSATGGAYERRPTVPTPLTMDR
jgi:hypothetical protein